MKKLILIFLLIANSGVSSQFKPLNDFFLKDLSDDNNVIYIMHRCAGLYLATSAVLPEESLISTEYKGFAKKLMLKLIVFSAKKNNTDVNIEAEFVKERMTVFADTYIADMENSWVKNGTYIDNYIKDELNLCNEAFLPVMQD